MWRSGVGVDANGALIYAGGPALSVLSLARTLQAAGAVRAMELDINTDWVSAYTYVRTTRHRPQRRPSIGIKLLDDMTRGGDRYLQLGERDFFAFIADPKVRRRVPTTDDHDHAPRRAGTASARATSERARALAGSLAASGDYRRRAPGCRSSCSSAGRWGRGRRRTRGRGGRRSAGTRPRRAPSRGCGRCSISTASATIGSVKLGQPVPDSNLVLASNSSAPQPAQR